MLVQLPGGEKLLNDLKQLHERDFNLWIEEIKTRIRDRDVSDMDWDNLLDEIDDMGASQKRALKSYTQRLVEHILKLQYWDEELERCQKGWKQEVTNFRNQIISILEDSPSLKNYQKAKYDKIYSNAIAVVKYDFEVPKHSFVELEKIMQEDYFG